MSTLLHCPCKSYCAWVQRLPSPPRLMLQAVFYSNDSDTIVHTTTIEIHSCVVLAVMHHGHLVVGNS